MEKQTSSVKNVKTLMLPESSDDNKRSQPLPQVQAYNRLTPDRSMPMPDRSIPTPDKLTPTQGNKHLWHQLPHNSDAKMMHLVPTDCVRKTSSWTSSVTDSKFKLTTNQLGSRSWHPKSLRRFPNDPAPPSQRPRFSLSNRRKRSRIQQIRSKFLLQKQIGASSPMMS
jgi:hypothetical protein